jgi:hypothetical protein
MAMTWPILTTLPFSLPNSLTIYLASLAMIFLLRLCLASLLRHILPIELVAARLPETNDELANDQRRSSAPVLTLLTVFFDFTNATTPFS